MRGSFDDCVDVVVIVGVDVVVDIAIVDDVVDVDTNLFKFPSPLSIISSNSSREWVARGVRGVDFEVEKKE